MRTFTVSFFGHRQIEAPFQVESQLEKLISQLLQQNEFVEFLVGREGEFDQLVSSTIRRCKRNIRDDNSALIWVMPYPTAEFRDNEVHSLIITMKLKFASRRRQHIINPHFKSETGKWLTVPIWLLCTSNIHPAALIRPFGMCKSLERNTSI